MPSYSRDDFQHEWIYSVEREFESPDGQPATWEPDYPKQWGRELRKIKLAHGIGSVDVSTDEMLLAVASERKVYIYRGLHEDQFELVETLLGHINDVGKVRFHPLMYPDPGSSSRRIVDETTNVAPASAKSTAYMLLSTSSTGGGNAEPSMILHELTADGHAIEGPDLNPPTAERLTSVALKSILPLLPPWNEQDFESAGLTQSLNSTMSNAIAKHSARNAHMIEKARLSSWSTQSGSGPFSPTNPDILAYVTGPVGNFDRVSPTILTLYSISSRQILHSLPRTRDTLIWSAFSPDGTMIAYASWDQYVRICDVETGEPKFEFGPCGGQMWPGAWAPDSSMLAVPRGSPTTEIYVWDITEDSRHMKKKEALGGEQFVVIDDATEDEVEERNEDESPKKRDRVVVDPPPARLISTSHAFSSPHNIGWSRSMSFSPDGTLLAAGGRGGHLMIINPMTGAKITEWAIGAPEYPAAPPEEEMPGTAKPPRRILKGWCELGAVQWLSDGRELLWKDGADGGVEVWDRESNGRKRWGMDRLRDVVGWDGGGPTGNLCVVGGGEGNRRRLIVSPDGDGCVRVWAMDE